jgi:lipopolysaccharide/colanic/teichoic acid biosynthesis glycosyltransferase
VFVLTVAAVFISNHPFSQSLFTTYVPLFWRLEPTVFSRQRLLLAVILTAVFVVGSLIPLYKPRPWRLLDIIAFAQKRVVVSGLSLATLGYFEWSYRLPRATLTMTIGLLFIAIPLWFVQIRQPPKSASDRTLIVGDDPNQINRIVNESDRSFLGYLCPPNSIVNADSDAVPMLSDGGESIGPINRLGGLSRLENVLIEYDIGNVVLAFYENDRKEFFGTLDRCHRNGIAVQVHQNYAENILTGDRNGNLVNIDIEPWDVQDYILKRGFDIVFAGVALIFLTPLFIFLGIIIKLDSDGPVFFTQKRTRRYGGEFTFIKFRTMVENAEDLTGVTISAEDAGGHDPRVTRVGRILRKTHLDEAPQLWSVLIGEMSVVGPRPAQAELEAEFENETPNWGKRWFVKPGLTGLAQINDATGHEPDKKLHYDLAYINQQSLLFDIKIITRQFWKVAIEAGALIRGGT